MDVPQLDKGLFLDQKFGVKIQVCVFFFTTIYFSTITRKFSEKSVVCVLFTNTNISWSGFVGIIPELATRVDANVVLRCGPDTALYGKPA